MVGLVDTLLVNDLVLEVALIEEGIFSISGGGENMLKALL